MGAARGQAVERSGAAAPVPRPARGRTTASSRGSDLLELAEMAAGLWHQDRGEALRSITDTGVRLTGAEFGALVHPDAAGGGRLAVHVSAGAVADGLLDGVPDLAALFPRAAARPTTTGSSVRRAPATGSSAARPEEGTDADDGVVRLADVRARCARGRDAPRCAPVLHPDLRSYLAVPVATAHGLVGALLLGHREAGRFDERAEVAARAVAAHAATATENGRLLEDAQLARERAEASARRLGLLQEITGLLSTAVSTAEISSLVPAAVTAALGCSGTHLLLVDTSADALVGELARAFPASTRRALSRVSLDVPTPSTRAVRSGLPVQVSGGELRAMPGLRDRDMGDVQAVLAVPLLDSGRRPLGVLTATWVDPDGVDAEVTDLLLAVASQVGLAMERTRLYDAEQRARAQLARSVEALTDLARTLQRGLLPRRLPDLSRVQVAVRYQPAVSGAEVGGDWYDAIALDDGTVTFVIGDVQGHSTTAAGLMGQLRTAVRAYLTEGHDPATALARTNSVLVQMDAELFATCCLMQLDQATGEVVVATAGHPPPLVLGEDGAVVELEAVPGLPLGIADDAAYVTSRSTLPGRSRVLLYTDGVVESPTGTLEEGLGAVSRAAVEHRARSCDVIADRVLAGIPHRLTDDAALLVLDYAGPVARRDEVETELPADLQAVAVARQFLRQALGGWAVDQDVTDSAELLASELVTNAVTHTGTSAHLVLCREPDAGLLRISVADRSTRHPTVREADLDALGGRGLAIVDVLASAWGVTDQGEGKAVWAEVLLR